MARNCEKHFARLNRVFLEEQWKKDKEMKRPPLHKMNDAAEVKRWIPSIKKEIDYCLQQLSGARKHTYPDNKIKDFEKKVERLRKEHNRFVMKAKQLDPTISGLPWQPRGYTSKRKQVPAWNSTESSNQQVIATPLLTNSEEETSKKIPEKSSPPLLNQHVEGSSSSAAHESQSKKSSLVMYDSSDSEND